MDDVLGAVALSEPPADLNGLALGGEMPRGRPPLDLDVPSAIAWNHMNVVLHQLPFGGRNLVFQFYSDGRRPF
jgi:hypothetical protein